MSNKTADPTAETELQDVLRKTLAASDSPLSASQLSDQLTGPFRRSSRELQLVLEAMVDQRQIYNLGKYGRSERYWDRPAEDYARQLMRLTLSKASLTRSELQAKVKNELRAVSENRRQEILRELIKSGEVRELPPHVGARTKRLSTRAADPQDYVAYALEKVCAQLAKEGIAETQVHAAVRELLGSAPSSSEPGPSSEADGVQDLVLARVMEIEAGTMLPFAEFRQGLEFQDRAEVDQAIWELVRQQRIAVHKHHHPASLSEDERATCLRDGQGNLYHGISRRPS